MYKAFSALKARFWEPGGPGRYRGMDTLRGACCVLMAVFHLVYALAAYHGFPAAWLGLPVVRACQLMSSRGFILLSGMACRLSRSNARRGIVTLGCGMAVSAVSFLWGDPILFGILHFMGCAAIFYGVCKPLLEKIPPMLGLIASLAGYLAARQVFPLYTEFDFLFPLGLMGSGFRSADYYPLLPYLCLFLAGSYLMELLRGAGASYADGLRKGANGARARADEGVNGGRPARVGLAARANGWLMGFRLPVLEGLGRNALLFYALHQPVILGLLAVIEA